MKPFRCPSEWEIYRRPLQGLYGNATNGALVIPSRGLKMVFSNGAGWEHVSVSADNRMPTWEEMSEIKDKFWDPEACVVQYHPPRSCYVNFHEYCLHLWRPIDIELPMPQSVMV